MKSKPKTIRLSDYRPCDYLIDTTDLSFDLVPSKTAVKARLVMRPNTDTNRDGSAPLVLNGVALTLTGISINNVALDPADYEVTDETLTIFRIDMDGEEVFTLDIAVDISPDTNTTLEGLYTSAAKRLP